MRKLLVTFAMLAILVAVTISASAATSFFQGFETNTSGWDGATRVASGADGVTSATGSYHADAASDGSTFTHWGGYESAFPTGGYVTSIAIYLDVDGGWSNDTRFDWDSAINDPSGNSHRDFIFNGGFYNDTDLTGSGNRFVFSASNNSSPGSAYPKNPGRDPFTVTTSGWYTFTHRFYDDGAGVLAVNMSISDSSGTVLHTWTLSDPTDVIGTAVGGHRYGWFDYQTFSTLAFDDSRLNSGPPAPADKDQCKNGGWQQFSNPAFTNQGDCIQFVNTGK
jgi:hypothetical protein